MKLLFLHSLADPALGGGAEHTLWGLMHGLRHAGHECVLLCTSDKPGLQRTIQEGITVWNAEIRNVYWPYHKKRPAAALRLLWHTVDIYNPLMQSYIKEIVKREKPDAVSIHNLPGWSSASWDTFEKFGIPIVQVLHDYYALCAKATMHEGSRNCVGRCLTCCALRLPHRKLSRRVQAVVGVSKFVLDQHLSLGLFSGVPIQKVIHNARSPEAIGCDETLIPRVRAGLRYGYIGRLDSTKGIDHLIDEFLAAQLPGAELWIAGSGKQDYEESLYRKIDDSRIHILGQVSARDFYPQIDVVVVPSNWNEPLGMVVVEALSFGKPVIAARRGGIPEMIKHGINGLLFEPDAPGELRATLEALYDHNLRENLAQNAQPSSERFRDVAGWIQAYEALFGELIDSKMTSLQQVTS